MRLTFGAVVGVAVLFHVLCAFAQLPSSPIGSKKRVIHEATVALTGATVIDGTGSGPLREAVIAIAKDRIVYVGGSAGVQFRPNVEVVDLHGRWVVPGFIDMHAHVPNNKNTEAFLKQLVAFGTTTLRAPANPHVELRERINSGTVVGPRMFVAGMLIDGKQSFFGDAPKVSTEAEMRDVVRRQVKDKVDFIKLYTGIPPALVKAAVEEAHRKNVRVVGHLGQTRWGEAAEIGIDSLTHSWYAGLAHSVVPEHYRSEFQDFYIPNARFDPELFAKWRTIVNPNGPEVLRLASILRSRRIAVDPNLVHGEAVTWGDDPAALERLEPILADPQLAAQWRSGRHPYSAGWSSNAMREAKLAWPLMVKIIRVLHEQGVLLTIGTDYLNPWMTPGIAFHRELEILVSAGIPPVDVLRIATRNGAEALGILKDAGTIESGKRADLVVLAADPLANIANTRKIEAVFLRGTRLEPERLLRRVPIGNSAVH